MTQIVALISRDYAMLASDRLLTWNGGPNHGRVFRDEECKLVGVSNLAGIGYTGLARLQGRPTHEWIGIALAKANSRRPKDAVNALLEQAPSAVRGVAKHLQGITFLVAGWDWFGSQPIMRPHLAVVSNQIDDEGQALPNPSSRFTLHIRHLRENETFAVHSVGQPLSKSRTTSLNRNLRRLVERSIGPKEALRYLVDEIQFTSKSASTVGDRILAMCIPLASVQNSIRTSNSLMIAAQPSLHTSTFAYFDPTMNELSQFGPTMVNGQLAFTDVATDSNPNNTAVQSVSIRILHLPPEQL